jgi:IS5 family transposase
VVHSIGQERFGFAGRERGMSSPDMLVSLINWSAVAALLGPLYPAFQRQAAWPPLAI